VPITHAGDGCRVVRDEQVGEPEIVLQLPQQVHDLGLHGHVERGQRLVQHDQIGLASQGAGEPDTLALASGELVRMPGGGVIAQPVHPDRLPDRRADAVPRVERRLRVLEHHRHAAAQRPQVAAGPRGGA
jgi:hypothetical protein